MQQPTLLITGGAGYIGSHTALLMAQQGYRIIVLDKLIHGQPFNYPWATLIKEDFANKTVLADIFKHYSIDAVMHFAAFIEVGQSVKEPLRFYTNNVHKTVQLIETMLKYRVNKFIFSSSCAVYGEPHYTPIDEKHPKNPISPYGHSKLMVEQLLNDIAHAYDFKFVSLRYFNAAGATPEHNLGEWHNPETHLIPLLLRCAREKAPCTIFGSDYPTPDGTCMRDFLHVMDIADAHSKALQHLQQNNPSDYFNLGTGSGISVKQMIDEIERLYNMNFKRVLAPKRAGDPPILVADPSKASSILKWRPQWSNLGHILKTMHLFEQNKK